MADDENAERQEHDGDLEHFDVDQYRFFAVNVGQVAGIIAELALILLVNYTPLGNRLFGTAPIAWSVWLFAIPFALGMFILEESRKRLAQRKSACDGKES